MPSGPRRLYDQAKRDYASWERPDLLSKRLRMVIRLIALEEKCQELGVGALPPQIMLTLRLLSDYREATRKRYYRKRDGRTLRMDSAVPFAQLICMCGHSAGLGPDPVIAKLSTDEAQSAGVTEAVFCSWECAGPRKVVHVLNHVKEHIGL